MPDQEFRKLVNTIQEEEELESPPLLERKYVNPSQEYLEELVTFEGCYSPASTETGVDINEAAISDFMKYFREGPGSSEK